MNSLAVTRLGIPATGTRLVLLCDESPAGLSTTAEALGSSNVPVRYAEVGSGEEALAFLKRLHPFFDRKPENPSVILLDAAIATLDDCRLIRLIRACEGQSNVPIVVFSALDNQQTIEDCWNAGASGYLIMPFNDEDYRLILDRTLRYWLGRQDTIQMRNLQVGNQLRLPDWA